MVLRFLSYCRCAHVKLVFSAVSTQYMERLILEDDDFDVDVKPQDGDEEENPSLCLVGHFLTDRPIRVHVMEDRMAEIWCPLAGVAIRRPLLRTKKIRKEGGLPAVVSF